LRPVGLGRRRLAVATFFATSGVGTGLWAARLPDIKEHAGSTNGTIGLALGALACGSLVAMQVTPALIARRGPAWATTASGLGFSLVVAGPGVAPNALSLVAVFAVLGFLLGLLDVAMNAEAARTERAMGRSIMSSLHALFSAGVLAGAGLAAASAALDVPVGAALGAAGLVFLAVSILAGRELLAGPAAGEPVPEPDRGDGPAGGGAPARKLVVALAAVAFAFLLCEGSAGDWSAIYLRDSLGASSGTAALGLAAFSLTMTGGRLVGDRLSERLGRFRLIRLCALLATAGMVVVVASPNPAVGIAGFAIFGAGLSCVIPQLYSAASDPAYGGSPAVLARVAGVGYSGLLVGPWVIGQTAELTTLRWALVLPLVLVAAVLVAGGALAPGRGAGEPDQPNVLPSPR
jgi:MFS family permease